jgi:Zn-dependent metalloprotease
MDISNYEETLKCRKRKTTNIQKGNENNKEGVQTLTNCYREKKVIKIRRKASKNNDKQNENITGEEPTESKDETNHLSTSRRIQVRYPKTLSPRPNVKTILKYVF